MQSIEGFSGGASAEYWENQERKGNVSGWKSEETIALEKVYQEILDSLPEETQQMIREVNQAYADSDFDRIDDLEDQLANSPYGKQYFDLMEIEGRLLSQKDSDRKINAKANYLNTAGEIEARDTANRRALTAEERKNAPPDLGDENTVFAEDTKKALLAVGLTTTNKPFVEITDDILAGVPRNNWRRTVKNNLRAKYPSGITIGNNNIVIDQQSQREMTYSRYTQWLAANYPQILADKFRATNNADEILAATQDWINEGPLHPRTDNINDFARGNVLFRVGGNDYIADVIVAAETDGKLKLYDIINLTPTSFIAKETDTAIANNPSPGSHRNTVSLSSNNSILPASGKSNPQNRGRASVEVPGNNAELEREYKRRYDAYMAASDANDTEFDYRGEIAWLNEAEKQIGKERAAQIANGEVTPGRTDGPGTEITVYPSAYFFSLGLNRIAVR